MKIADRILISDYRVLQRGPREASDRIVPLGQRAGDNDPDSLLHHAVHVLFPGAGDIVRVRRHRLAAGATHLGFLQHTNGNAESSLQGRTVCGVIRNLRIAAFIFDTSRKIDRLLIL